MGILSEEIFKIIREAAKLLEDRELALNIHRKGAVDYVTEVDLKVQEFIEGKLNSIYPDIQFMGEEKSNEDIDYENRFWILDPVDGTTNLIHDYREVSISLALVENKEVVLGMIYQPFTEELFYAQKGEGAYLNDKPIFVSQVDTMSESLISIGTAPYYEEFTEGNFKDFLNVFKKCQDIRRSGSAALDLAYVACGRTDAYFEKRLKLWDFAAGILLIKEAGGMVTNYTGENIKLEINSEMVASNGKIHSELIDTLYRA